MKLQELLTERFFTIDELRKAGQHYTRREKTAKRLGVNVDDLNNITDYDLQLLLKHVGKHDSVPDSKFDVNELKLGIDIELEHTKSKLLAKLIAKDHLSEISDYYTRLRKMEKQAKDSK